MTPNSLLKSLEKVAASSQRKEKNGNAGWVTSLIMFFVALVGVFIFAWASSRNSRELAELRHEKNKREIEHKNAEVARKVSGNELEWQTISVDIGGLKQQITDLDNVIKEIEVARKQDLDAIDSINSWKDV